MKRCFSLERLPVFQKDAAPGDPFWTYDLQNCNRIHLRRFKPTGWWSFVTAAAGSGHKHAAGLALLPGVSLAQGIRNREASPEGSCRNPTFRRQYTQEPENPRVLEMGYLKPPS